MYELKKSGKVFTSKSVGTGPSSYEKRIYRTAVSQRLRNRGIECRWHKVYFTCEISALNTLHRSCNVCVNEKSYS